MATLEKRTRALNAMERQWVIDKYATAKFWTELAHRFQKARLWVKTIMAVAVGTLAWVKWGAGWWETLSKVLSSHGAG